MIDSKEEPHSKLSQYLHFRTKRIELAPNNRCIREARQLNFVWEFWLLQKNVLSPRLEPQPRRHTAYNTRWNPDRMHSSCFCCGCGWLRTDRFRATFVSCLSSGMRLLLGANFVRFVLRWRHRLNFECDSSLPSYIIWDFGNLTVTTWQSVQSHFLPLRSCHLTVENEHVKSRPICCGFLFEMKFSALLPFITYAKACCSIDGNYSIFVATTRLGTQKGGRKSPSILIQLWCCLIYG